METPIYDFGSTKKNVQIIRLESVCMDLETSSNELRGELQDSERGLEALKKRVEA
jgi:hypothetical protein